MNVLITNDDGIDALGIKSLIKAMPKGIRMIVAAPANQKSATSHSISLGQKIRVEEYKKNGIAHYKIHGTPADCTKVAISVIPNFYPDLVVSGINQGANTGVSVYYSGTISAAREGFINRIPAVAISLCSHDSKDFTASADIAKKVVEAYRDGRIPKNVMLNINVPALSKKKVKGIKITKQANSRFVEEFIAEKNHGKNKVYSLAGEIEIFSPDGTSDEEAVALGFISITPLKLDLTEYKTMAILEKNFLPQDTRKSKKQKQKAEQPFLLSEI